MMIRLLAAITYCAFLGSSVSHAAGPIEMFGQLHLDAVAKIERIGGVVGYKWSNAVMHTAVACVGNQWGFGWSELRCLRDVERLEVLIIEDDKLSNRALKYLRGLKHVRTLRIRSNAITDEGLSHISSLQTIERLDLDCVQVTAKGVLKVCDLMKLSRLEIYGPTASDGALFVVRDRFPKIQFMVHRY